MGDNLNEKIHFNDFSIYVDNGIVVMKLKTRRVTRDIARSIMDAANALLLPYGTARYYPTLIDLSEVVSVDEGTMDFMADDDLKEETAIAFLLANEINELVFSVFEQFAPMVPMKGFFKKDWNKAVKWLSQFRLSGNR